MNRFLKQTICGIVLLLSAGVAPTAIAAQPAGSSTVTTNVTAENMVYDSAAQRVTFSGNVKVVHPDFVLSSDRLQLFLAQTQATGARDVDRLNTGAVEKIIAESKVNIKLPEGRIATCSKATYTVDSETFLMEGSPALREGNNRIRGDKMIFYLRENRNEVQGKVEVDFVSGDSPSGNPLNR